MSEYRQDRGGDDTSMVMGDDRFIGVNQRLDPALLPEGYCSDARNFDFRDGVAKPRRGFVPLIFTNRLGATWPWVWPVFWDTVVPFGLIHRVETFSDPNGAEWTIIAADGGVYRARHGTTAREIPIPAGEYITAPVDFVQCFNVLVMLRGPRAVPLVMRSFAEGFVAVTMEANTISGAGTDNPTDGTESIPNGTTGVNFGNRLLVVHGRDLVAVSDVLNYTRYQPTLSDFRITEGTSDALVCVYKFNDSTLLCFKEHSIVYVTNVSGDLAEITQVPLTSEYGCVAAGSVVGVGSDVWFLSEKGIATVKQTDNNKVQSTAGQMSDPIEPTIRRINWRFASGACAATHDGKVFFALPLDAAEVVTPTGTYSGVNNAIVVYDLVNQAWCGLWDGTGVTVRNFCKFHYNGRKILGYASVDGYLVAMDEGLTDFVQGETAAIGAQLTTRGYSQRETGELRFRDVELDVATHAPDFSVYTKTDGVEERIPAKAGITRDKTRYFKPFNRVPWVPSNVGFDFAEPYREDYAVDLVGEGAGMALGDGIVLEQHQRSKERIRINKLAKYCQIYIDQESGLVRIHGVKVTATAGRRRRGVLE